MKNILNKLLCFCCVVLFACGSNEESDPAPEQTEIEDVGVADSLNLSEEDIAPDPIEVELPNSSQVWQIDDYVSLLLDSKIYANQDEINYSKLKGPGYYYVTLDIPGGFAKVAGAFEGWYEFVLYRMDDGNDLVGEMSVGCGPVCSYDFDFITYVNGQVENDNPDIFPKKEMNEHKEVMHQKVLDEFENLDYGEDAFLRYNFPQKGTDMSVDLIVGAEEVIVPILLMSWDGMKFRLKEKYMKVPDSEMY